MPKAIWNDVVIAESDKTEMVEGNHYFPPEAVNMAYFTPSSKQTTCPWKGKASYYSLEVNGQTKSDAAWVYPQTKEAAKKIEGYFAFSPGVQVEA